MKKSIINRYSDYTSAIKTYTRYSGGAYRCVQL